MVSVIRSLNHPESSSLSVVLLYILRCTRGGTNISHLGKRKIIFKSALVGDMLVRGRVHQKKKPRDPFYSPVNYRLQEGMRTVVPRRAAATKPVGNIPLNRRWLMVGSFSQLTYIHMYNVCMILWIYIYIHDPIFMYMILVPSAVQNFYYYVMWQGFPNYQPLETCHFEVPEPGAILLPTTDPWDERYIYLHENT